MTNRVAVHAQMLKVIPVWSELPPSTESMTSRSNNIEMTASVVMECKPGADPSKRLPGDDMPVPIERMHFLLEKNWFDGPKVVGPIKVADLPSMRVLSIAFQGDSTAEAGQQGQAAIESRLKEMTGIG